MNRKSILNRICGIFALPMIFISLAGFSFSVLAASEFNFSKSTPVGSWAIREELQTDHKGRKSVSVVRMSVVGKEDFDGSPHVWIEAETQQYKIKKDKRKKQGKKMIMKTLLDVAIFSDSPANIVGNLNKYAKTIIMQTGDADPMKIEQGGAMAQSMMQAAGITVEYDFTEKGSKTVEVPAGKFTCKVVSGSGSTETKILIKKFKVSSVAESCYSSAVPFGLVQSNSDVTTNGKKSTLVSQLMEYGATGAKSAITKDAQEMPQMPKLF